MFRSKRRDVIVPQWEHARLSGMLAALWGGGVFERPALDFDSFVLGVTFHDRDYGFIDAYPLQGMAPEDWLAVKRGHLEQRLDDPIAEAVAVMHMRRLLTYAPTEDDALRRATEQLKAAADDRIAGAVAASGHPQADFAFADRITAFCDAVAFDFAFEAPADGTVKVFATRADAQPTELRYRISGGVINVDPWPFAVDTAAGFVLGYQATGYPDNLQPVKLDWRIARD
ncbi:MAG: DUF3891 family protein [Phototrophicaceae bacterium]